MVSSSRSRICSGVNMRSRSAASSSASGIPSSRRQISASTSRFAGVTVNPGLAALARSMNSCRASPSSPAAGTVSGGTGITCSPGMPSTSRLVASTRTSGVVAIIRPTSAAHASIRCSQLSMISSSRLSARNSVSRGSGAVDSSRRFSASATLRVTRSGSWMSASSISQTPSGNARDTSWPICRDNRVLPIPPGPSRVSTRVVGSSRLAVASSSRRPTKLVTSSGRFPLTRRAMDSNLCDLSHSMPPAVHKGCSRRSGMARLDRLTGCRGNRAAPASKTSTSWPRPCRT